MKQTIYIKIVVLLLLGCSNKPTEAEVEAESSVFTTQLAVSEAAIANAGITTGKASLAMMQQTLQVNGVVDVPPQSLVSISFPLGGYLKNTDLLPGMHVRKGQVIATMEDQAYVQLQQDYLQAIAQNNLLLLDYERQKELSEFDASSKKIFQQAKTAFEMQQVLVKSLGEKLLILGVQPASLSVDKISRTLPVRSPIDGYVKSVFVNIGKYVNPSDVLFEIVDPRDIHAAITVFEKDLYNVKENQKVKVFSAGRADKPYQAEIILVSRDIDENRGATIHCHFIGDHGDLLPGMYISAAIELDMQQLPTVPEDAVVRYQGKYYVFTVQQAGQFTMTEVTTGERIEQRVALTNNNIDWTNQEIVLTGAYALLGKLMNSEEE